MMWECVRYVTLEEGVVMVEVIPTEGHTESTGCWCEPETLQVCDECDNGSCWKCGGRGLAAYDQFGNEVPVIVHREES